MGYLVIKATDLDKISRRDVAANTIAPSLTHITALKQATFLSTRTAAGSELRRYRWRMMASAVLV